MSNSSKKQTLSKEEPLSQEITLVDGEDPIIVGGGTIPPLKDTEDAEPALQIIIDGANWTLETNGNKRTITINNLATDPWIISHSENGKFAIKRRRVAHGKVEVDGYHQHDSRDKSQEPDGNPAVRKEVRIDYKPV